MMRTKDNYYTSTYAKFVECATPRRKPDYISSSGSSTLYKFCICRGVVIIFSPHHGAYIKT